MAADNKISRVALSTTALGVFLAAVTIIFLTVVFKHISYPLIWNDESDTVMFGQRVLEYGYPKVHGPRNIVYGLKDQLEIGVNERFDAYTGAPWGYYYFAAIGVALAEGTDDLYGKTARLRFPFALIGVVGLAVLLLSALPTIEPRSAKLIFAILFVLLLTYSVSLILHLREARYYSLVIFLASCLLYVFTRFHVFENLRFVCYGGLVFLLLLALFNTFYPAFVVFLVAIGVHHSIRALSLPLQRRERLRWLLWTALPLIAATACVPPLLMFFDFASQVGGWLDEFGSSIGVYLRSVRLVLANLLRYEFLAPAIVMRLTVQVQLWMRGGEALALTTKRRVDVSNFLWLLVAAYCVIVARTPFIFERYFIALSPIITLVLLLDGFTFLDLRPGRRAPTAGRLVGTLSAALVGICLSVTLAVRIPEFRGRIYEIRHQYRGPLDYVIPYLKDTYANTKDLIIATNYEEPVYMYYLASHVIVGYYGADLERDVKFQPDIIIPRRWGRNLGVLRTLAARADYKVKVFPVKSLLTNGFPGLSLRGPGGIVHEFRTRLAEGPGDRLVILERTSRPPGSSPRDTRG